MVRANKNNIRLCPRCKGNGYIKYPINQLKNSTKQVTVQCPMCKSRGEIDDPNDTIIIDADGTHRLQ